MALTDLDLILSESGMNMASYKHIICYSSKFHLSFHFLSLGTERRGKTGLRAVRFGGLDRKEAKTKGGSLTKSCGPAPDLVELRLPLGKMQLVVLG